jgi:hypothetical protein
LQSDHQETEILIGNAWDAGNVLRHRWFRYERRIPGLSPLLVSVVVIAAVNVCHCVFELR